MERSLHQHFIQILIKILVCKIKKSLGEKTEFMYKNKLAVVQTSV